MKLAEYEIMSAVEDEHWWYVGLRDLLARLLRQREWPASGLSVLDAGCGTGANLRFLQQQLKPDFHHRLSNGLSRRHRKRRFMSATFASLSFATATST